MSSGASTATVAVGHDVREVLKLVSAISQSNALDKILKRTVHRIDGHKQLLERPTLLLDSAIKESNLRALYLPDRRRVLLDDSVPLLKHRWLEAHECSGEDFLSWHRALLFGDDEITITPACHARIETEANFAAGQLLFLRGRFVEEAKS